MSGIFSLVNRIVRNSLYGCQVFVRVFSGAVLQGDGTGFVGGGVGGWGCCFLGGMGMAAQTSFQIRLRGVLDQIA